MTTGNQSDIASRLWALLPPSWFPAGAPNVTAILQGPAIVGAFNYSLIAFAKLQTRISTSSGFFLDLIAFDYFGRYIRRRVSELDAAFLARIKKELLRQRVTRAAMSQALTDLTGSPPIIFEPWNTGDTGAWDIAMAWAGASAGAGGGGGFDVAAGWGIAAEFDQPVGVAAATGAGVGGWGDTNLPAQVFITVTRPGLQGVPGVSGWDCSAGAWDAGAIEFIDDSLIVGAVTDADIYATIEATKPTGVICWTRLQ
jgi:hypothetical protein